MEHLKNDFPYEIEKLVEALNIFISENDLEIFKTELPDKWKFFSKKLAYPYNYFSSSIAYQKP